MDKRAFSAILTLAIGLASSACAEPLDSKQVPSDAKWLVHFDVDAIKTGKVARAIGALWWKLPAGSEDLKRVGAVIGLDPVNHLHGITIYGRRYDEPAGVVVLRAKVDRNRLIAFLKTRPGYRTEPYGKHELVTWIENRGRKNEHLVTACFHRAGVIVFGREAAEVRNALDVLDGASPALGPHDPLWPADTPPGTMIQARGVDLAQVELPFKSPLVRKSKVFSVALGEHGGKAFAVATAETESAEMAGRLRAVVDGLLAMAELQYDSDRQATDLLEAVEVSSSEKTVTIEFRGPPDDVSSLIEKAWKKQLRSK